MKVKMPHEHSPMKSNTRYLGHFAKPSVMAAGHNITKKKASEILHDGTVHGKPLTKKQRGFMGAVASGHSYKKG